MAGYLALRAQRLRSNPVSSFLLQDCCCVILLWKTADTISCAEPSVKLPKIAEELPGVYTWNKGPLCAGGFVRRLASGCLAVCRKQSLLEGDCETWCVDLVSATGEALKVLYIAAFMDCHVFYGFRYLADASILHSESEVTGERARLSCKLNEHSSDYCETRTVFADTLDDFSSDLCRLLLSFVFCSHSNKLSVMCSELTEDLQFRAETFIVCGEHFCQQKWSALQLFAADSGIKWQTLLRAFDRHYGIERMDVNDAMYQRLLADPRVAEVRCITYPLRVAHCEHFFGYNHSVRGRDSELYACIDSDAVKSRFEINDSTSDVQCEVVTYRPLPSGIASQMFRLDIDSLKLNYSFFANTQKLRLTRDQAFRFAVTDKYYPLQCGLWDAETYKQFVIFIVNCSTDVVS